MENKQPVSPIIIIRFLVICLLAASLAAGYYFAEYRMLKKENMSLKQVLQYESMPNSSR